MHLLIDTKVELDGPLARAKVHLEKVLASAPSDGIETIPGMCEISTKSEYRGKLFRIVDGSVIISREGDKIIFLEAGDLFGLEFFTDIPGAVMECDFPVTAEVFDSGKFFSYIQGDLGLMSEWSEYLAAHLEIFSALMMALASTGFQMERKLRTYEVEDIIIDEDAPANEVFTLIEGKAEVYVDDVMVGEIHEDEIFGALAALTDSKRTGRVISAKNGTQVLVTPKEDFAKLIALRPQTTLKMVQDMARTIMDLNRQVVDLRNETGTKF